MSSNSLNGETGVGVVPPHRRFSARPLHHLVERTKSENFPALQVAISRGPDEKIATHTRQKGKLVRNQLAIVEKALR